MFSRSFGDVPVSVVELVFVFVFVFELADG